MSVSKERREYIRALADRIMDAGVEYSSGGKIRIKPENRGKFTALKERTGHSASWFKAHGTPAQKKMAVFELNSRHWNHKHADGGFLDSMRKLLAPSYGTDTFGEAFAAARKEGRPYFKWNGNRYNTKLNTEVFHEENPANYGEGYSITDAARRIMQVENSKDNPKGGYDAATDRWYPHRSYEGGADTIGYGIKLSNGSEEARLAKKQGFLTDEQAVDAVDSLVRKYDTSARKKFDKAHGEGAYDSLSEKSRSILIDYEYNPGLDKFPKLMQGFNEGNLEAIKKNYKRYSGGKPLGRNRTLLNDIDSLGTFYPIHGMAGGGLFNKYDGDSEPTGKMRKPPMWQRVLGVPRRIEKMSDGRINKDNIGILYTYPHDYAKRIFSEEELNQIRQNLYDHFVPTRYDLETIKKAANVAFGHEAGEAAGYKEAALHNRNDYKGVSYPSIRDEAFGIYLNPPVQIQRGTKYLKKTSLRPQRGALYNDVYSFSREANPSFEDNLVASYIAAMNGDVGIHTLNPAGEIGGGWRSFRPGKSPGFFSVESHRSFLQPGTGDPSDAIMGTYTMSSGTDPNRGQYISVYDNYDLNPSIAGKSAGPRHWLGAFPIKVPDMTGGLGKPFSIYDRVYLDDYYGVDSKPDSGSYYGGYLLPAYVSSEKKPVE